MTIPPHLQLIVDDPLTKVGSWKAKPEPKLKASCLFDDRGLVAEVTGAVYRCSGPIKPYRDFAITINVALVAEGTCAGIWFRYADPHGGFALQICQDGAYFVRHMKDSHDNWITPRQLQMPFAEPLQLGQPTRFSLLVVGDEMSVFRDDKFIGAQTDTTFTEGRMALGILQQDPPDQPTKYAAAFRDVQVWASADDATPPVTATR
jgi:hypothetical protein